MGAALAIEAAVDITADVALVDRCRAGESSAWRELYAQHFDFAWRMARRLGAPSADVEDIVQEAFTIAHLKLGDFREGRFSTWLFRIVANLVSGRRRRQKVRDFFAGLVGGRDEAHAPELEPQVGARLALAKLERLLEKLAPKKREAFALHELEGLSHEAISELVGAPVATVRTRLFHARAELEHLMQQEGLTP